MTVRPIVFTASTLLALAGAADACSNVYGIPRECRVRVLACQATPTGEAPVEVSSVRMDGNWAYASCSPAADGAFNVVFLEEELEVHYQGRRRRLRRDPRQVLTQHSAETNGRRFAFFAPRVEGTGAARIAVVDVRAMADNPPYRVVYTAGPGSAPFGIAWAAGQEAVLVIERREEGGSAIVRADVTTGAQEVLVVRRADEPVLDFVAGAHLPADGARRVLVGDKDRLQVLDVVSGELRPLPLPGMAIHNLDMTPDGRYAVVFYRRPVPLPDGRALVGVHVVDLDAALAGVTNAVEQLYDDATDVHTLWCSPDGRHVLWATHDRLFVRRIDARDVAPTPVFERGADDHEVKGAAFDPAGDRIAFTVGASVRVRDLRAGRTTEVARFDSVSSFCAQPWWSGDQVVFTLFQDVRTDPDARLRPLPIPVQQGGGAAVRAPEPSAPGATAPSAPTGDDARVEAPPSPRVPIDGMVVAVLGQQTPPVVRLSVGSDDKVQVGLRFRIYRGGEDVGVVVVKRVLRDSAEAEVVETVDGQQVQPGDQATTDTK